MDKTYVVINPKTGLVLSNVQPTTDLSWARWQAAGHSHADCGYVVAQDLGDAYLYLN